MLSHVCSPTPTVRIIPDLFVFSGPLLAFSIPSLFRSLIPVLYRVFGYSLVCSPPFPVQQHASSHALCCCLATSPCRPRRYRHHVVYLDVHVRAIFNGFFFFVLWECRSGTEGGGLPPQPASALDCLFEMEEYTAMRWVLSTRYPRPPPPFFARACCLVSRPLPIPPGFVVCCNLCRFQIGVLDVALLVAFLSM